MEILGLQLLAIPALTTLFWFISNVYLKLPLNQITLILSFVLSIVASRLWFGRPMFQKEKIKPNKLFITFLLFLGGVILFNLVFNLYWPIPAEYDAVANFDYKGKVFFLSQNIEGINNIFHASYPFFTSLGNTAMYFLGFNIPKIFYSYLLTSFLIVFYSLVKKKTNQLSAVLSSLMIITTPMIFFQARIAYSNFSYMVYLGLALIYLLKFLQSSDNKDLKALSLLVAVPVWIRPVHHPFFLLFLILILIKAIKDKKWTYLTSLVSPYLLFFLPWQYFQSNILAISSYETQNIPRLISQIPILISLIPETLSILLRNFTEFSYAGLTGIFCLSAFFYQFIKNRGKISRLSFGLIGMFLSLWLILSISVYVSMPNYEGWTGILGDSMRRLFIFIYPILVYVSFSLPVIQRLIVRRKKK